MRIWPGRPFPLGAIWDGAGTNFAVYSAEATAIDLCLFEDGREVRVRLPERTAQIWHGYVPDVRPGQRYGYRAHGPYDPRRGLRFNPAKLLIDPYARALAGEVDWSGPVHGYRLGGDDLYPDESNDAAAVPKGVVVANGYDWEGDRPPTIPWHRTVLYELHVKGFTVCHPEVDPALRGTYRGLASPPVLRYLADLGVTAVELLPIHAFADEKWLVDRGRVNYWGYNSINFFAPTGRYASNPDEAVTEFRDLVKAFHRAGIEVILDVVYNHTAEGNHQGATLMFKGLDNPGYYRLDPADPRHYLDFTGCGNTVNARHPQVLTLIMDSLRYWVQEMHVDGFRFDLAPALAREEHAVDRLASFFDVIHQDPVISRVKLIAEPWDIGEGGYQVGNFPVLWTEWNGRFRDSVRAWWKGDSGLAPEMAYRLTGSSDLYGHDGRHPWASINIVTTHDGFTLTDLVSYNTKHNEANGEQNRDGSDHNLSWNCGVEGPTADPVVLALRNRQRRNFLATLLLANGVPMILGGDEIGRTQRGNNNAYCQDNEISWVDWNLDEWQLDLLAFAKRLLQFRREQPAIGRKSFFHGRRIIGSGEKDLTWICPDGREMNDADWQRDLRAFGLRLAGDEIHEVDEWGNPVTGDTLLILMNVSAEIVTFALPNAATGWERAIDTADADGHLGPFVGSFELAERSLVVFRLC